MKKLKIYSASFDRMRSYFKDYEKDILEILERLKTDSYQCSNLEITRRASKVDFESQYLKGTLYQYILNAGFDTVEFFHLIELEMPWGKLLIRQRWDKTSLGEVYINKIDENNLVSKINNISKQIVKFKCRITDSKSKPNLKKEPNTTENWFLAMIIIFLCIISMCTGAMIQDAHNAIKQLIFNEQIESTP